MSETFFIGDTHFGHTNIIKYEPARQFIALEDMHEALIANWNSVVGKNDKVIHCGDFAFGAANIEFASRLNGNKVLIMGNHDTYPSEKYLKHFKKLLGSLEFDGSIVTHIPVHKSQFYRFKANIHGHTHSKNVKGLFGFDKRYINVSAEQLDLMPIPYAELKTWLK